MGTEMIKLRLKSNIEELDTPWKGTLSKHPEIKKGWETEGKKWEWEDDSSIILVEGNKYGVNFKKEWFEVIEEGDTNENPNNIFKVGELIKYGKDDVYYVGWDSDVGHHVVETLEKGQGVSLPPHSYPNLINYSPKGTGKYWFAKESELELVEEETTDLISTGGTIDSGLALESSFPNTTLINDVDNLGSITYTNRTGTTNIFKMQDPNRFSGIFNGVKEVEKSSIPELDEATVLKKSKKKNKNKIIIT